jgi:NADP-dependent 3-hydroxy acid dehydrogenase YdfG
VVLTARSTDKLEKIVGLLEHPEGALALRMDVTDTRSVQEAVNTVYSKWGRIDVLINNVSQ